MTLFSIFLVQLLNVYAPKFETGGTFWPIVHGSMIFSLVLMHIIAIGIFGLKELPLASIFCVPLPFLTLLFHDYCQKRFLPIFKAYPAEVHFDRLPSVFSSSIVYLTCNWCGRTLCILHLLSYRIRNWEE